MTEAFMCMECNDNCHGAAKDFTICSACRTGMEAEIERLNERIAKLKAAIEWIGATTDSPVTALYCNKALGDKDDE